MIRCMPLALVVLFAGSAAAQYHTGPKVTVRTAEAHTALPAGLAPGMTMIDPRERDDAQAVYDNTTGPYVFWFGGGPTRIGTNAIMDSALSVPNADGSYDISGFAWGVGPNADPGTLANIDFHFVFYDTADVSGDSSMQVGQGFMVGIGIGTFQLDSTYFYTFGTSFDPPLHISDKGMYVEMWMTDHDTDEQLPRGVFTWLYQDTFDFTTWAPTIAVGSSDAALWSDANDDGQITSDEGAVYLGGRHQAFFKLDSATNRWCPADFNHDGFSDFFDFNDFVDAFESGC